MRYFALLRFWLVWLLAIPFVLLYLVLAAIGSGQWRLIGPKFGLIQMSLRQRFGSANYQPPTK